MSTMGITIGELIPSVSQIKKETERVVEYSRVQTPRMKDMLRILRGMIRVRTMLKSVVSDQSSLIKRITSTDFTKICSSDLEAFTNELERGVASGRCILSETNKLGSEIRIWWRPYIDEFAEQIEHFDSISESLRMECDSEATLLLAIAASSVAPDLRP